MLLAVISAALGVSFLTNIFLVTRVKKKAARPQSVELREFLGDLLSGPALVAIARIDQDNILMRSPKSK